MYLKKFLLWFAGIDDKIEFSTNPIIRGKLYTIGALVAFLSLLVIISSYYALIPLFEISLVSVALGIMWGILIMGLIRQILLLGNSFKSSKFIRFLLYTLRLIFLALLTSMIFFPLITKVFDNKISESIYRGQANELYNIKVTYDEKIIKLENEKKDLVEKYNKELNGDGDTQYHGSGPISKALKSRVDIVEASITELMQESVDVQKAVSKGNFGIVKKVETLNKLRNDNVNINILYYLILFLILAIELLPFVLRVTLFKYIYIDFLSRDEKNKSSKVLESNVSNLDTPEFKTEEKGDLTENSLFKIYCAKNITKIQSQINHNQKKASELMRYGIIIIISGIVSYLAIIYFFVVVFLEVREFKPHYTYFMIAISLLFLFIQFLGGWFLKQYRKTLNNSLYLNNFKKSSDKYLLSYYAICEFTVKDDRKKLIRELLFVINSDTSNLNQSIQDSKTENFASEVMSSINSLKDLINNLK